ncbi:Patatin phospholipase domain-containing protein 7 [Fasciola gigantica]|uniref:Patatin phospholipase domain-containing protein 7 n=1 Tax=Fasciola gigantica TaxID=46835 RepID=A0A504YDK2_FASGI|nr:Patatin phospholipase domain-containing protein 7 [Fasciola gigantica]
MTSYLLEAVMIFPKVFQTGENFAAALYNSMFGYIGGSVLVKIFPSLAIPHNIALLVFLTVTLALMSLFLIFRHVKNEVVQKSKPTHATPRFRKRDKLRYYASRFGRRFSEVTEKLSKIKSQEDRRLLIVAFVKRILNIPDELNATTLDRYRLPESFFEPDEEEDSTFPEDLKLMISSIRVFGHLEKSLFIDFCKFIETVRLKDNEFLFRVGDPDEYLYVVNSGKIQLYMIECDGSHSVINEVGKGGSIDSFFSVLQVLTNNPSTHTSMEAVALEQSVVLRLPTRSFLEICKPQTPALMRILQMIIVRLQRLTFTAVQHHLGLYSELVQQEKIKHCSLKSQEILAELNIEEATTASSGIDAPPQLSDLYSSPSFEPETHPEDNIPADNLDPIIGEFQNKFDPEINLPPVNVCTGLELGEAPSRAIKEKVPFIPSRPSTPTNDLEVKHDSTPIREPLNSTLPSAQDEETLKSELSMPSSRRLIFGRETDSKLMEAVREDMAYLLNLPNPHLLNDHVNLLSAPNGTILSEECEMPKEIFLVVSGEIHAIQSINNGCGEPSTLLICPPGELVGLLGLITGEANVFSLKAVTDSVVAVVSRDSFFALVRLHPSMLFSAIRLLASRVSPLLHQLDFAIQWIAIDAGKALYKRGDPANHVYVVLSGRLRRVDIQPNGGRRITGEFSRGDLVGFLEVVSSQSRVQTVLAIRDSEVAQIPALLLHHLKEKVPQVLTRIVKILSDRLLGNLTCSKEMADPLGLSALGTKTPYGFGSEIFPVTGSEDVTTNNFAKITMSNLRTIAILPATSAINAEAFTLELQHSMTPVGSSVRLTSRIIKRRLGSTALDSVNQYRLNAWLSHQEDLHRIVFFVCNSSRSSAWNRLCIRQADCVLVLALGNSDPSRPSPMEVTLKSHPTKVAKALVLMYPLDTDYPTSRQTAKWLNVRPWISHHYHIRCEPRVFTPRSPADLISFYSNVFAREKPNPLSDFSRLARYLTGEAIALVLGGGGARGCAHAGVLRAFQDAGVPIDLIGGTSMGAFMSALWAEETRFAQFTQRARNFTETLNSIWNRVKDFTYPAVSIFSGKEFNNQLEKVFGERQVEDLWIPSFYVTTDITNCKMRVHTQGSLWRYVRASMSLSGYMPPLCDPYDGSLLLDGGYTNNVPADVMALFGAKTIFAVDVGASVDTDFTNYGDYLSGWSLLYHRFFGSSSSPLRVPNLTEIQSRLAYISCVRQLAKVKESGICHYMRPPIDGYMTLQFSAFDEILTVGYDYAKNLLRGWHEEDKLRHLVPGLRPGPLFEQPNSVTNAQSQSHPHSQDGTATPSAVLTQGFDGQRTFIDLAETLRFVADDHLSRVCNSDTEDEFVDHHGSTSPGAQLRTTSSLDLFDSLMGRHWRKRPAVRSLSEAVCSYLNSASRIVSRSLPDNGFFRRRALSVSLNVSLAESSSLHDSSDEAGHYSDALDHPTMDSHLPTFTELLCRKSAPETGQTNESNVAELKAVAGTPSDLLRTVPPVPVSHFVHDNDDGYLEDNESDGDRVLYRSISGMVDSDPELSHEVLDDVNGRKFSSYTRRFRSSSLVRTSQNPWSNLSTDQMPQTDQNCPVTDGRSTKKSYVDPPTMSTSGMHSGCVRRRRRHRRSSLDRLRHKTQPSPPASDIL